MESIILPAPIIANIMTAIYHVNPYIKYRLLNKQIYRETAQVFYEKYGNCKISELEYSNYINTHPSKFGYLQFSSYKDIITEYYVRMIYHSLPLFKSTHYHVIDNTLMSVNNTTTREIVVNPHLDYDFISFDELKIKGIIENYDLLTLYNVYKSRTNCTIVNKHYAQQKIIEHLELCKTVSTKSFLHIYCYYQYLILNCFVFNIVDEVYDLLPSMQFNYVNVPSTISKSYMMDILENPIDVDIYNQQKLKMLNDIERLELKIINHIHNNL